MVRKVAACASHDAKERCIAEGIECLLGGHRKPNQSCSLLKDTVKFLRDNDLALAMSDKEGGFFFMEKGMFLAKANDALKKNFVLTQANLAKVKREALRMCDELNLPKLRKDLVGAKREALELFYTAKTHKEEVPFRAIVMEKGSWQGVLFRFLQKQLNGLHLCDPFLVRNSDEVVGFFSELQASGGGIFAFSIDAEDLFYSIPKSNKALSTRVLPRKHT